MSSTESFHLPQPLRTALAVSVGLHLVFVAWLRPGRIELPRPYAVEHLEVSFAAAPAPRTVAHAAKTPAVASNTAARKATPSETTAAPAPAENSGDAGRDEPLVEAKFHADTLHNPKPPYPLAARRRGLEGRVLLSVLVRTDGTCGGLHLKQSSGHGLLDRSALDTVRRWRFLPARRGNTSIDSWVDIPISFRLEG